MTPTKIKNLIYSFWLVMCTIDIVLGTASMIHRHYDLAACMFIWAVFAKVSAAEWQR
jgi:hypothetical protein